MANNILGGPEDGNSSVFVGIPEFPQVSEVPCLSYHRVCMQLPDQALCDVDTKGTWSCPPLYPVNIKRVVVTHLHPFQNPLDTPDLLTFRPLQTPAQKWLSWGQRWGVLNDPHHLGTAHEEVKVPQAQWGVSYQVLELCGVKWCFHIHEVWCEECLLWRLPLMGWDGKGTTVGLMVKICNCV